MARNPILTMLSGAAGQQSPNNPLAMMGQIKQMVSLMRGKDPERLISAFAQKNPQFADFLRQNHGKSPDQIAADYGIDMAMVRDLMR